VLFVFFFVFDSLFRYCCLLLLQLLEAFGAGTAAVVSPVKCIVYQEQDIHIPTGENAGPVAMHVWNVLRDIHYGIVKHPWSVPI
jgi:branched-chain amino acid aminotransferase